MIIYRYNKPNKLFDDFCNSLKCPLCSKQLCGYISSEGASLFCKNLEYKAGYTSNDLDNCAFEEISYNYPRYDYSIYNNKNYRSNKYITYILQFDKSKLFLPLKKILLKLENVSRINFFYQKLEEQELLNKIKLYSTFS